MKQRKRPKAKTKRRKYINTKPLKRALEGLGSTVKRATDEGHAMNPQAHLPSMRDAVKELQDAVEGFKREIKRRMLADPRLKDGAIKTKGRIIHLKPRPGTRKGSKNPDHYDIVTENIH